MKYKVIKTNNINELEGLINHELAFGWKPIGGISVTWGNDVLWFYQAMVLEG